jgi:hypothetical protein
MIPTERFIHHLRVERPGPAETAAEARVRLGAKFPRTALRRMTHLGLLTGAVLDGLALGQDDTVIYATSYAETRALEDYLASFPTASPLLFQTSIHPSAVQQVMIGRQQPIRSFWPMTGRRRLVEAALLTALIDPAPRVVLTGGEERGTWLLEQNMASDQAFAFGLVLAAEPAGAKGLIRFQPTGCLMDEPCPTLNHFAMALAEGSALHWRGAGGEWSVEP